MLMKKPKMKNNLCNSIRAKPNHYVANKEYKIFMKLSKKLYVQIVFILKKEFLLFYSRQEMNRLNRKVDELSQVRQTVNQISTQVNFERQEMSRLRKTVQKTSLEIKKVENSVSSRLSSLEEKFQSTSGGGVKITRTSEEPVEDGDHVTSLKKLEQLSRIYGKHIDFTEFF